MSEAQQLEILARKDFVDALRKHQASVFWQRFLTAGMIVVAIFFVNFFR